MRHVWSDNPSLWSTQEHHEHIIHNQNWPSRHFMFLSLSKWKECASDQNNSQQSNINAWASFIREPSFLKHLGDPNGMRLKISRYSRLNHVLKVSARHKILADFMKQVPTCTQPHLDFV